MTVVRGPDGTAAHFVSQIQDIADRKTAEGEMRRYARHLEALSNQDPLTGLANRRAFNASLAEELNVLAAGGSPCSLLLVAVTGDDAEIRPRPPGPSPAGSRRQPRRAPRRGRDRRIASRRRPTDAAGILERTAEALDGIAFGALRPATARTGDQPGSVLARAREGLGAPGPSRRA